MERNLKTRSNNFAHEAVDIPLFLPQTYLGNHIKQQLIRCSTSVTANYRAACLGQSKKAFISKLAIVIEEADECIFWIEFLKDENIKNDNEANILLKEARELTSIFRASRKTAVRNLNQNK